VSDVIVVGGGLIGCSAAWRLAQRGRTVTILDRGFAPASRAGAGMLAPGGEVEGDSPWALRSVESRRLYPAFVEELREETGLEIDFRACGAIELAYSEHEWTERIARAAAQRPLGIPASPIAPAELRELAPGLDAAGLAGAMLYPEDAIVDPVQVLDALQTACRRRGVEFGGAAVRVDGEDGAVQTETGVLRAETVVLAAGAWSGDLLDGAPKSFPVKGHLIGYQLRPASLRPIVRCGHTYILQRSSGFTIAGSTTQRAGFDARVDAGVVERLHRRSRRYLPGLLKLGPDASWVGFRPAVDGGEPRVGQYGDTRVWLAYGHYRNGILLAPVTSRLLADAIAK
jgi:glycine oxidase